MRSVRSIVGAVAIAFAVLGAGACVAKLDGAPCPCIEPEFTCVEPARVCLPTGDAGEPGDVDAAQDPPDGGGTPDAGFLPDAGFGAPDADI